MARTRKHEQGIDIRLDSQDHSLIDLAARKIAEMTSQAGAKLIGPVPLRVKDRTVGDTEIRRHRRRIIILNPTPKIVELLTTLDVPTGVNIRLTVD